MKITCPLPRDYNLTPFILKGVREFYFGYIPEAWKNNYSLLSSPNRRYSDANQINSKAEIAKALRGYKKFNLKINLVFNSALFNTWQIDCVLNDLSDFIKIGITGVIIADAGLILAVKNKYPGLKIHVSCIASCLNSQSALWFKKIGADRIILPDSLTTDEIRAIRDACPDLELEALIFSVNDCSNIDGLCTHLYGQDSLEPPCAEEKLYLGSGEKVRKKIDSPAGYFHLYKAGIDYMKVLGRGKDTQKILELYGSSIRIINSISRCRPGSFGEWIKYLRKQKNGNSCFNQ